MSRITFLSGHHSIDVEVSCPGVTFHVASRLYIAFFRNGLSAYAVATWRGNRENNGWVTGIDSPKLGGPAGHGA